jgi:hypothetical protein
MADPVGHVLAPEQLVDRQGRQLQGVGGLAKQAVNLGLQAQELGPEVAGVVGADADHGRKAADGDDSAGHRAKPVRQEGQPPRGGARQSVDQQQKEDGDHQRGDDALEELHRRAAGDHGQKDAGVAQSNRAAGRRRLACGGVGNLGHGRLCGGFERVFQGVRRP